MPLDHQIRPSLASGLDVFGVLGRTEDLRFAPGGDRLAVAGFGDHEVAVLDVAVTDTGSEGSRPDVAVTAVVIVTSEALDLPHGVDWLDRSTLVVGNRGGDVVVLPVPASTAGEVARCAVDPLPVHLHPDLITGPGSLAVVHDEHGTELVVCNNWANTLTTHRLTQQGERRVGEERTWLRRHLDIPDGVAVSADGRWLAVSDHGDHVVLVYDRTEEAEPDRREPVGVLRGVQYPHGLRFTADGRHLLVADAGAPFVHRFDTGADGWAVAAYPSSTLRVLDDEVFSRGHHRRDEGGPKGIDLDPTGRVLAVTCELQPLALFALGDLVADADAPAPGSSIAHEQAVLGDVTELKAQKAHAEYLVAAAEVREHDARALGVRLDEEVARLTGLVDDARAEADAAATRARRAEERLHEVEAHAAGLEAHLEAMRSTLVWRLAAPPRALYARARSRRRAPAT